MDIVDLCSSSDTDNGEIEDPFPDSFTNNVRNEIIVEDKISTSDDEGVDVDLYQECSSQNVSTVYKSSSSGVSSFKSNEFDYKNDDCGAVEYCFSTIESRSKNGNSINISNRSKKNKINKGEKTKNRDVFKKKEKACKKILSMKSRSLKPGECLQYMILDIGMELLSKSYFTKITDLLSNSNIKYNITNQSTNDQFINNRCICWMRNSPQFSVDDEGEICTFSNLENEKYLLVVYEMSEMETLLCEKTLNNSIHNLKEATDCQITILLHGSKDYFKSKKAKKSSKKETGVRVTENDLDYYLTKLLFEESVSCMKADTHEELAQIVLQFTKSIAELPFQSEKHAVDQKATFYMRGDNKACINVDKDGRGLLQLWCKSLTKFPSASLETAHAICERFPSPYVLIKYLEVTSSQDAIKTLADIGVRRAAGPLTSTRRIGIQLAQKLYTYFTANDGSQPLL